MGTADTATTYTAAIVPSAHEKAEWSRLATDAYKRRENRAGHRYSVAASLPNNAPMALAFFDQLQAGYRSWLIDGVIPAVAS